MKNFFLVSIVIFLFSMNVTAQENKLVKGELYHVAVGEKFIATKNVEATVKKYSGKVKTIIQSEKLKDRDYRMTSEGKKALANYEPIDHKSLAIKCFCIHKFVLVILGCGQKECEDCCQALREDTDWEVWVDLD